MKHNLYRCTVPEEHLWDDRLYCILGLLYEGEAVLRIDDEHDYHIRVLHKGQVGRVRRSSIELIV